MPDVGIGNHAYIFFLGLLMSQFCLTGCVGPSAVKVMELDLRRPCTLRHNLCPYCLLCAACRYDASAHMTEETERADILAPLGMLTAVFLAFVVGWCVVPYSGTCAADGRLGENSKLQGVDLICMVKSISTAAAFRTPDWMPGWHVSIA